MAEPNIGNINSGDIAMEGIEFDFGWIKWLAGTLIGMGAIIASKSFLVRTGIRMAVRQALKWLWKYIHAYRAKFAQDTQPYRDVTEIAEAIDVLCRLVAERLGIDIRAKQLNPTYKTRKQKRSERKSNIKQRKT